MGRMGLMSPLRPIRPVFILVTRSLQIHTPPGYNALTPGIRKRKPTANLHMCTPSCQRTAGPNVAVWQENAKGRYANDDPQNPPKKDMFVNRARLVADENGYYEYETIHPGPYKIGDNAWRPSHIHYIIAHPGYKALTTQLF